MPNVKCKWNWHSTGHQVFYDGTTFETLATTFPVFQKYDFLDPALDTTNLWTLRDTGNATEALVGDAPNGVISLALTNANEVQLAGTDWNDNRTLTLNQGLIWEARIKLAVLPTGAVVACWGLCGDHNAAVDTVAESIWFRADGSGAVTVETDDTSNETSQVATGVTLLNTTWAVFRIDCTSYSSVKFFINGTRVAASTTFNMSQVAALALQPVFRIGKEAGAATVGTMYVDYCAVMQNRS